MFIEQVTKYFEKIVKNLDNFCNFGQTIKFFEKNVKNVDRFL